MDEKFKQIPNLSKYEVSTHGNVRNIKTGRVLKTCVLPNGYKVVSLQRDDNPQKTFYIHSLVAKTFLINHMNKPCVDHIDNDKLNNSVLNLRFTTHMENQHNRKMNKNNTSGYKGVIKVKNRYKANICIGGKLKHLGYFDNINDAVNTRVLMARELFGQYCNSCETLIF